MMKNIDTLVVAHSHPAVVFRDEFGYKTREKVWIKGEINSKELKKYDLTVIITDHSIINYKFLSHHLPNLNL